MSWNDIKTVMCRFDFKTKKIVRVEEEKVLEKPCTDARPVEDLSTKTELMLMAPYLFRLSQRLGFYVYLTEDGNNTYIIGNHEESNIASFKLVEMPGCSGVVVSTKSKVKEAHRSK